MTETPRHAACPACGAALRPGSPWCTLCYADLRPPEERPVQPKQAPPPTSAPPNASYGAPAGDPLTQPLLDFIAPPPTEQAPAAGSLPAVARITGAEWPCLTCGERNPLESTHCTMCGAPFLAAVGQASRPSVVLPIVGDLSRLSRAQRVVGALALAMLFIIPVAIISIAASDKPAPDTPVEQVTPTFEQPTNQPEPSATPTPTPSASVTP